MTASEDKALARAIARTLLDQRARRVENGLYWETQIAFVYNSEKMEGNALTHDQTRLLFETGTLGGERVPLDDALETRNHFRMVDLALDTLTEPLSADLMKRFHRTLKTGTSDDLDASGFAVGGWKTVPNGVAGIDTAAPQDVDEAIGRLLAEYRKVEPTLENIVAFHVRFETIHPFQDGNGRVGRVIMFRECLKGGVPPFVVLDAQKQAYYRGLDEFQKGDREPLLAFCRRMSDVYATEFLSLVPEKLLLPETQERARRANAFDMDAAVFGEGGGETPKKGPLKRLLRR